MVDEKGEDSQDKELATIEKTLNQKLKHSGVEFSGLKKTDSGYTLDVNVSALRADPSFFIPTEGIKNLVKPLNIKSFGHKFNLGTQYQELLSKMQIQGAKDILEASKKDNATLQSTIKQVQETQNTLSSYAKERALDLRFRSPLSPLDLDLRDRTVDQQEANALYKRSNEEYQRTGIYGSSIDVLSDFSSTGFYNEIPDPAIKAFYDSWGEDVDFYSTVGKIFHHLYKYNVAIIMAGYGPYEQNKDGVSSLPGREPKTEKAKLLGMIEKAMKAKGSALTPKEREEIERKYDNLPKTEKAASTKLPVAYTLLNPEYVKIEGSGFFGAQTVTLTSPGLADLKKALDRQRDDKMSKAERERLKLVPTKLKAAAQASEDYIFDLNEVFVINFRKDDSDIYGKPLGARIFDSLDYKDELVKADYATLDGVFNYILKVTVGDKDHPVTDLSVLEDLAEAFNTPQKAFSIVWNHTLNIEKITTPDIGSILGKDKYAQVESDIEAGLGISRAVIDGSAIQPTAGVLSAKALQSKIDVARKQVTNWIYSQYKLIAIEMSFTKYPVVRWRNSVLNTDSDAVSKASIMQLADRKLISQSTAMRDLGLDPDAEQMRIREELKLEEEGVKVSGSPFQQTKEGNGSPETKPSGDQGRPKGQPTSKKKPVDDTEVVKRKTKVTSPSQQKNKASVEGEIEDLIQDLRKLSTSQQKIALTKLIEYSKEKEE
jgi:hypothetical protein